MSGSIHIVAVGARTPLGFDADSSFAAVRSGISGISEHPSIVDRKVEPVRLALDYFLAPDLLGTERLCVLAETALKEVCRRLEHVWKDIDHLPLFLCLPEERPGWSVEDMQSVEDGLRSMPYRVEFDPVEIYPHGHASGLMALNSACELIESGRAEICVILGVDSYLNLETIEWLDENKQLATSYHRGAFFPGEGAGAIAVASRALVTHLQMKSLAVVRGIGIAAETMKIKTDTICLGEGLTESVKNAVMTLQLPQEAVGGIICDLNGERYRSEEWGFALLRLPDVMVDSTDYDSPASCWGDVGAASGPLFAGLAVTAWQRKWAKSRRYLIWNSSEGGQRAAAVLGLGAQQTGAR